MKYELETIPIWDAYKEDSECPLCILAEKAEAEYLKFFLGNSVMVPEMRVEVNKTGFCPRHYTNLFNTRKNRHGLGLVSHTYLKEQLQELEKLHSKLSVDKKQRGEALKKSVQKFNDTLRQKTESCMICDRVDYTLKRYSFTIVYLWKKDPEFRETFNASKGFCLKHVPEITKMAGEVHSGKQYSQLISEVARLQQQSLERLEPEISWFTQKFDFQNDQKPWGTSKDALHRLVQKLTGIIQRD